MCCPKYVGKLIVGTEGQDLSIAGNDGLKLKIGDIGYSENNKANQKRQ
jgi:glutathionylspermidine synthase